jgi:hypothetical protein
MGPSVSAYDTGIQISHVFELMHLQQGIDSRVTRSNLSSHIRRDGESIFDNEQQFARLVLGGGA